MYMYGHAAEPLVMPIAGDVPHYTKQYSCVLSLSAYFYLGQLIIRINVVHC